MGCQLQAQGTTGVLKTSRLPTWIVNFGVGEAHPKLLLDAVLRGQPTWKKILCGQVIFVWIAHAAAECIAASLSNGKNVSTAMFTDPVQPLYCHHRHHQPPLCTCFATQTDQQFQLLPRHHH